MEFFEVLEKRTSIRAYADIPVEEEKVEQILEAINRAPSAGNLQTFDVYVVTNIKKRTELAIASRKQHFIAQAPVVLVFCAHPRLRSLIRYRIRGLTLYTLQDATIACSFAMLSATALGLSTVWVGAFKEYKVRQIIKAPLTYRPIAILPVGYAAVEPRFRPRQRFEDLVHRDQC